MRIGHERFDNDGNVLGGTVFSSLTVEVIQEAGVVPCCRRAAIGTPYLSHHSTRRETVGVFYQPPTGIVVNPVVWQLLTRYNKY